MSFILELWQYVLLRPLQFKMQYHIKAHNCMYYWLILSVSFRVTLQDFVIFITETPYTGKTAFFYWDDPLAMLAAEKSTEHFSKKSLVSLRTKMLKYKWRFHWFIHTKPTKLITQVCMAPEVISSHLCHSICHQSSQAKHCVFIAIIMSFI